MKTPNLKHKVSLLVSDFFSVEITGRWTLDSWTLKTSMEYSSLTHHSWRGAPGSGRCRGIGGSRGRKAEEPSEVQLGQQLNPTGRATAPRCPVTTPNRGSAQGDETDTTHPDFFILEIGFYGKYIYAVFTC